MPFHKHIQGMESPAHDWGLMGLLLPEPPLEGQFLFCPVPVSLHSHSLSCI